MLYKTALVTGASSGIGAATAKLLAESGVNLILLARREEKLREVAQSLQGVKTHILACDINDRETLAKKLGNLPDDFQEIDLLINNAGLALGLGTADDASWADWETMIETNCLSLVYLTRLILPQMVERNIGHIVNLGSIAGNYAYKGGNVYGATKAFVDQFSINLRADLLGLNVRVTNLQPGMIGETEFSLVRFHGDEEAADAVYEGCQALTPEDIAETVRWVVTQPPHVNINRMEIMPTCQAPAGLSVSKS